VGLALAGGGPLGGIYEVGALLALTDSLDGIDLSDLDVYVGVSSGGFVAAALANGISPAQMYRLFIDDGADAALTPEIFLRPALSEFMLRAALLPRLAGRAAMQYLRDPFRRGLMESLATLSHALPTGMFDNRAVGTFLERLCSTRPHQRFSQARPQTLPRRDQPRHRRARNLAAPATTRSRSRPR
jgi:predicted acylesterase/phospholipase RssA